MEVDSIKTNYKWVQSFEKLNSDPSKASRNERVTPWSVRLPLGDLDEGLRGAVEEDELGGQVFLQLQLAALSHQVDVEAELEDAVHVGQLREHDLEGDAAEVDAHEAPDHEDERDVEADDPEQTWEDSKWNRQRG